MRHAKFSFPLQVGCLLLASASKISLPPAVTQAEYSAFAGIHLLPAVTPKPSASVELLRRQSELSGVISGYNTCGYGALNPAISVTCSSDERCENIGQFRACCNGDPIACSATVQTSCKDYDPTIICATKTRCCKSAEPYCITWLYNTGASSTLTAWGCSDQNTVRALQLLPTPLSSSSSTISPSTATTSSVSTVTDSPPAATDLNSSNDDSETSTGAIIGGVLGGIAVVALSIFGFIFIRRRKRRTPTTEPPLSPATGPQELASSSPPPHYSVAPQYETTGQPKHQVPMAEMPSPGMPIAEAPTNPSIGTNNNRAELA